jgi:hypothetical protein
MPTKRTPINRATRRRISPKAVAAFKAKDEVELHRALGLKPWEASPLDAGPRASCPWPSGTGGFVTWGQAQALRAALEAAVKAENAEPQR